MGFKQTIQQGLEELYSDKKFVAKLSAAAKGEKFKKVLENSIDNLSEDFRQILSDEIAKSLNSITYEGRRSLDKTFVDTTSRKTVSIDGDEYLSVIVKFDDSVNSVSWYQAKYPDPVNLVTLFNYGYDAPRAVWRIDENGKKRYSLTFRPALHFVENAIKKFNDIHSGDGSVVRAEISKKNKKK